MTGPPTGEFWWISFAGLSTVMVLGAALWWSGPVKHMRTVRLEIRGMKFLWAGYSLRTIGKNTETAALEASAQAIQTDCVADKAPK